MCGYSSTDNPAYNCIHNIKLSRVFLTVFLFCLPMLVGCFGSKPDPRGERFSVQGEVLLDNQPLSDARILFVPVGASQPLKSTGTIRDGVYSIESEDGPLAGKMRVEIQPEILGLEEFEAARGADKQAVPKLNRVDIPTRYHEESELIVEIKPGSENKHDFYLTSK